MTKPSPAPHDPLQAWENWALPFEKKPVLIRKLAQGSGSNRSYLIKAGGELWVLRCNGENTSRLGIDRRREAVILKAASEAGLMPEILLCSAEHGILISRYIEGQHWQAGDGRDKNKQKKLLELIERVHEINIALPRFNYLQHLESYWQALELGGMDIPASLHSEHERLTQEVGTYSDRIALCHHDPNPGNIIFSNGKLYLLDWEYAGNGWPGFDAAAWSSEWAIPTGAADAPHKLMQAFYLHLCSLWALLGETNKLQQA